MVKDSTQSVFVREQEFGEAKERGQAVEVFDDTYPASKQPTKLISPSSVQTAKLHVNSSIR
jgi:hypothetical protein